MPLEAPVTMATRAVMASLLRVEVPGSADHPRMRHRRGRSLPEYAPRGLPLQRHRGHHLGRRLLRAHRLTGARAVGAARTVREAMTALDLQSRAGIHTGECEMEGRLAHRH